MINYIKKIIKNKIKPLDDCPGWESASDCLEKKTPVRKTCYVHLNISQNSTVYLSIKIR